MHVTKDKMEMTYAVDVVGQKMYLNSFYEVIKKGTETVIFKISQPKPGDLGMHYDWRKQISNSLTPGGIFKFK